MWPVHLHCLWYDTVMPSVSIWMGKRVPFLNCCGQYFILGSFHYDRTHQTSDFLTLGFSCFLACGSLDAGVGGTGSEVGCEPQEMAPGSWGIYLPAPVSLTERCSSGDNSSDCVASLPFWVHFFPHLYFCLGFFSSLPVNPAMVLAA